jgi:hypothetical protein
MQLWRSLRAAKNLNLAEPTESQHRKPTQKTDAQIRCAKLILNGYRYSRAVASPAQASKPTHKAYVAEPTQAHEADAE